MNKPDKNNEIERFLEWSEKLCEDRHNKLVKLRIEKSGNNPFKKWFYLGKKKNGKYAIEEYYYSPYDKLRYKAFNKWQKKVEKYGLEIARPYMYYGKTKYSIWKSNNLYLSYNRFSILWWKEIFENIKNKFKYGYQTCTWDYYDIFTNLIVKLTIKGLYLGLYGRAVNRKEQMHEIWECRKELIKAYNFDDYYEWKHNEEIKDYEWYTNNNKESTRCIKNAFSLLSDNIRGWWD